MSEDETARVPREIIDDWLATRGVIVQWLQELLPHFPLGTANHAAEALLARLAAHDPPLLIMRGGGGG